MVTLGLRSHESASPQPKFKQVQFQKNLHMDLKTPKVGMVNGLIKKIDSNGEKRKPSMRRASTIFNGGAHVAEKNTMFALKMLDASQPVLKSCDQRKSREENQLNNQLRKITNLHNQI